ncbi:MAG: sugar phosphate isomerase/epimerase family protein [Oscillospiraceae bacterium]|nr:sugar phosphate isomerase/epimerase family protein [Oscillospiraceae bacterium]
MKKGFSMFSFSPDTELGWAFGHIKKAGYDGVEPILSEDGYLNCATSEKEVLAIGRMAAENGLEIPSVGVWSLWENNLVSDDAAIRQKAFDIVRRQIEFAHLLGADSILVVPGYVGCDFASKPERIRYDVAYERSQQQLLKLEPYARQAGVKIAIENVWNRFLLSPLETTRFIDEIGSDYVGVYFDVGNIVYIGYPDHWIEILGPRIKKIHLSDYRAGQAGLGAFVDLMAGDVDFCAVAKALAAIHYDDWLTLEMLPNYKQFPEISMFSDKFAMDKIVQLIQAEKCNG